MIMMAKKVTITSTSQEQEFRRMAKDGVPMDTTDPDVAYLCARCDVPVAFTHSSRKLYYDRVECANCGAINIV
jgi:DNA-directed RNA polymerase subunit RPC12/RpoP